MIQDELKYRILQTLGVPPTVEQAQALDVFAAFMTDRRQDHAGRSHCQGDDGLEAETDSPGSHGAGG